MKFSDFPRYKFLSVVIVNASKIDTKGLTSKKSLYFNEMSYLCKNFADEAFNEISRG